MNERIKELAEQAEMAANKGDHVDVKIMMAEFAELIVRECAEWYGTYEEIAGDSDEELMDAYRFLVGFRG